MNEVLWFTSRATGVASVVLLSAVVVLGTVTAGRRRPEGERATVVMALHRWIGLGTVVFLGLHVVTAVVETYVSLGWLSVLVPFTSGYERLWVGLGTLALDLLAAVVVTSLLRHRISERAWRGVHLAAWALWPVALVHGTALGTSEELVLRATTVACAVAGAAAVAWRLQATHHDKTRRALVRAQGWT
jgi:predicted ferric reductase